MSRRNFQQRKLGVALPQVLDRPLEAFDVLEVPVHAGVAYVGHPVHLAEPFHHHFPNVAAGHFPLSQVVQLHFDVLHHFFDGPGGNGALGTGLAETPNQLFPIELLSAAILLGYHQSRRLRSFVSGEPRPAFPAFAAPADAAIRFSRVGHFGVGKSTKRAAHFFARFLKLN